MELPLVEALHALTGIAAVLWLAHQTDTLMQARRVAALASTRTDDTEVLNLPATIAA
ncbi:hypothetical protein GCM10011374_35590 [Kocuria dechangensis]|uniref:HPt domain-containing protein n=1 Tax=Kocuria dechangensis TaxID=1176249 RepID=A0A917H5L9_9MICC|nr:hypothetical protein [Kocuria dechangensis]GGG68153.1 hypothetical protein GCM10011374_35590 [Kocuria dechangensis]